MLLLKNNESGFTIIEILISLAILGVVIPTIATGINTLTVLNNRTRDLTLTNLSAENKAEKLRNQGFNSLDDGTFDFSSELPTELASPKSGTYTISNTEPGIKEITINISYRDYGNTRTLHYKTIVSELGVGQ